MSKKALIIFIEGQDRCGKSSIIKPLFNSLNKIHNVIDRGALSNYVYSKEFNRDVDLDSYLNILKQPEIVTVYLDTSIQELKNRTIKSNDYNVPLNLIAHHKNIWDNAFLKIESYPNTIKIANSTITIDETVNLIKEFINKYEEDYETRKA